MATPTYVVTLPLKTELGQEHKLNKRLEIARGIYNACLGEALKRIRYMKRDPAYRKTVKMPKGIERNQGFRSLKKQYGVEKYALNGYVQEMGHLFKQNIGSQMAQNLAERAFAAAEKVLYGKSRQAHFVPSGHFFSVEEKTNQTGLRYFSDTRTVKWLGLVMPVKLKTTDEYAHTALLDRVKYCRLMKKQIRGKDRFFIQLVLEGIPPKKRTHNHSTDETARVGLDIGTATLAVVSDTKVQLVELAEGIEGEEKKKRRIQRRLDRQRRANNPNKFNEDGTIKKGNKDKWVISKNYQKTRRELTEIQRKIADKRKQSHNRLANAILSLGLDVRVEQMNWSGLQKRAKETTLNKKTGKFNCKKRFGKSLAARAPALFLKIVDRKLSYLDLSLKKIDTAKVKASQFEHINQTYTKKNLSQRWNSFEEGQIQRDLYSAFLILNTTEDLKSIDRERVNQTWKNFHRLHDAEINRLKGLNKKQLSSIGL